MFFWRWALWKVLETRLHPATIAFLTPGAWLFNPTFNAMRGAMRRAADRILIIDLTPEGNQPPAATRIFPGVSLPLCAAILSRYAGPRPHDLAPAHCATVRGTRENKFQQLNELLGRTPAGHLRRPGNRSRTYHPTSPGAAVGRKPGCLRPLPHGGPVYDVFINSFSARWQDVPPPRYRAAVLSTNLTDQLLNPPDDPTMTDAVASQSLDAHVISYVLGTRARPGSSTTPSMRRSTRTPDIGSVVGLTTAHLNHTPEDVRDVGSSGYQTLRNAIRVVFGALAGLGGRDARVRQGGSTPGVGSGLVASCATPTPSPGRSVVADPLRRWRVSAM